MMDNSDTAKVTLERARHYVKLLEAGESEQADDVLAELTDLRESQLFNELGRLTRDFHEALNSFSADDRIATLAQDDIPDARERLNYVITKTSESAHKTLGSVESAIPVCESLEDTIIKLGGEWEKFLGREMKPQEFRELSLVLKDFFDKSASDITIVRNNLTEILMAQDFQDITGQIITRVIKLVEEVENNLVDLVKLGSRLGVNNEAAPHKNKESELGVLEGPQVPGMESEDIVASQDDVDELLSSLGF